MASGTAPATRRERRARNRWRMPRTALIAALIALLGTAVLLYPSVGSWFMQWEQSQLISDYAHEIHDLPAGGRDAAVTAAERYNALLTGSVAELGANERIPTSDATGTPTDYAEQLRANEQGLMARIQIPRIDADLPIYHGTSDDTLAIGVGHLEGTALPVGGLGTHSVLTAHRGLATAELFSRLNEVEVGDTFTVSVFGEVLTYQVRETAVVEPEDTETLHPQTGEDLVTLVTCTPLGINSHRILVTAERIIPTPVSDIAAARKTPVIPRFPWWAVIAGGVVLALSMYVYRAGRPRRKPSKTAEITATDAGAARDTPGFAVRESGVAE